MNIDKIYLFIQFYIPNNKLRYYETVYCLKKNTYNKNIDKIYLLNERIYTNKELGFNEKENNIVKEKIKQINLGKRLMFSDVFKFVEKNEIDGYIIMSNSDIYYDNTLNNIYKINFKNNRLALCQLRTELNTNLYKVKKRIPWSQDTWIYHSKHKIKNINNFDFYFGVFQCDNNMANKLNMDKFKLYNFPRLIRCIHVHREYKRNSKLRNSKIKNVGYLEVKPIYHYTNKEVKKIRQNIKKRNIQIINYNRFK